ncbi:MAG: BamA/TamA family outer membrane protein [Proteobacteria bacterium]|nr:BamA/TamA family outer membrane protein [Pseudomonadota bacterium]
MLAAAPPAMATTWRSQPGLIPPAVLERLAEHYHDLRDANDVSGLLLDIGRRVQMTRLEAYLEQGVWVIKGDPATLISSIDIRMTTRLMTVPVAASVQSFIGQVDAPETRLKVIHTIERYMKRHGYQEVKVHLLTSVEPGEGVAFEVRVSEGEPCTISSIELPFKPPRGISLEVKRQDLCDVDTIDTAVNNVETRLRDLGYSQVHIEVARIVYDPKTFTSAVVLLGALGQKIRYEVVDSSKRFIIDDLFTNEDLRKIDPTIVSPDAMSAELARRYRNRGFLDVVINGPEVKQVSEGETTYIFRVDPGQQYVLKLVQFEGAKRFTEKELLDTMELDRLWQAAQPYNYEEVQKGLNALRSRYQQAGYWDAKIRDPGFGQKDKDTATVRLTIAIDEGLSRQLHAFKVTGNKAIGSDEIEELLGIKIGAPVDRARLVEFQQQLRTAYVAKGFLYNDVKVELSASEDRHILMVDLHTVVSEGPRVRIGEINIVGLTRTHEKVVRRELLVSPGDWYAPDKIAASRQALTRLGIFRSVQIVPADRDAISDKEREIDLMVDVREGRPGNVSFGPGWSLLKGWNYGAEASYNNIGGVGRQASVRGAVSEEHDQYAIGPRTLFGRKLGAGYTEPYIFDVPIDASIRAKQEAFWDGQLWELSNGGEIEFKYRLRSQLPGSYVSVFYGQKIAKTEGSATKLDLLVASNERIGSVGTRFSIDRRDNLKFPTAGFTFDSELALARFELNGDVRYFKWDVSFSRYVSLMRDLTLAIGVSTTSFEDIQRKGNRIGILPPQERLQSGGDTVRGYPSGSLGPLVRGPGFSQDGQGNCIVKYTTSPLNGTSRLTIKTELRHRLSELWAVTGFIDQGNVFLSKDQMDKFQQTYNGPVTDPLLDQHNGCKDTKGQRSVEDNFAYNYGDLIRNPGYLWSRNYYSYGTSLNALTPIGAFNITYGLPWREPKGEGCRDHTAPCNVRAKQSGPWLRRGEFLVTVGARF